MSCPTADQVAEFMQGNMEEASAAAFEVHIDACTGCRKLLSALCQADSTLHAAVATSLQATWISSSPREHGPLPAQLASGSIGRYTVLRLLGAGGMGAVYAAHDPELDRNVALKIVHTEVADPERSARVQERLLFEARAMAQLAHPNVVAVHDLGRIGAHVFVAMELVEGQTLTQWLADKPRSWREIVAAFVAAGHGLAAAHAAGLVHRDFKPANVLVGQDGRVRVTDFGLAQAGVSSTGAASDADLTTCQSFDGARGLVGTPFFMSPEQFQDAAIDARTDQFSFCVALYQALHGCHPFPGATIAELAAAVTAGSLRPLPARPRAPRWVVRAILRGMSTDPANRFPSIDDLLRALQRDPHRRARRALAIAAAGAIAVAVGLALYPRSSAASSCADDAGRITAIWNPQARQRVMTGFLAGGKPYGPAAFTEVSRVLDDYRESWTEMRLEVCEAARTGPAQASELVALRTMCLDGRLSQVRALVEAFAGAADGDVLHAPRAVHELPDITSCADPRALLGAIRPPADPVARATIAALRDELADVRALFDTGRYAQGLERVRPLVDKALATSYRPIEAEALFLRGNLEYRRANFKDALTTLKDAVLAAEAGRNDEIAVRALLTIMYMEAKFFGRLEQAEREMAPRVMSIIERMGGSDELQGKLHVALSVMAVEAYRYDQAVEEVTLGLEHLERRFGPNDFGVSTALQAAHGAHVERGDGRAALQFAERLLAIRTRVLGEVHPETARAYFYVATALLMTGRSAEAKAAYDRTLMLMERTHGPEHAEISDAVIGLATHARAIGQFAEALAYVERSQAIVEKQTSRSHRFYGRALLRKAQVQNDLARSAEALAALREAEPILLRTAGAFSLETSDLRLARGQALARLGRHAAGRADVAASLAILDRILGPGSTASADRHRVLGHIQLALRKPRAALASFERAVALFDRDDASVLRLRADSAFGIARTLSALRQEPERARELAESARTMLAGLPALEPSLREVETWLARAR